MWSGLIHGILGIVNPVLNQRIDWLWFVLSQMGFGIVAGIVVSRQETSTHVAAHALLVRAGDGSPGNDAREPGGRAP